jgi:hypothetical protein
VISPNDLLNRKELSAAIKQYFGFDIPVSTLKTMAHRNQGPNYIKIGAHPAFIWRDACEWLESRCHPQRGVSENHRGICG